MSNLLEKASIVTTPTAYDNGKILSVKPSIVLGEELVVNGDFSDGANNWTISSSASVGENKLNVDAIAFDFFAIQTALTNGLTYKVTLDAEVTTGDILLYTGTQFATINSSDSYTFYTTSNSAQIRFRSGGSGFEGSITNISVKQVIDGDFDFTRNSSATRVNSQGLIEDVQILSSNLVSNGDFSQEGAELITNGDFATDSDWSIGSGWSISGSSLNGVAATGLVYQNFSGVVVGKTYKAAITVGSYTSGTISFKVGNDSYQSISSTLGIQEFYFTALTTGGLVLLANSAYTGSIDNVSVKEVGQDWTLGTGVTIGENKAIFTSTASGQSVSQNAVASSLTNGALAKVSFEVLSRTEGSFGVYFSGTLVGTLASAGVFTGYFTKGTETSFYIRALGTTSGSISNISVIEITDDTNLPRINYEGFSYQDALGSELVTNGDFSDGTNGWNAAGGGSISVSNNQLTLEGNNDFNFYARQAVLGYEVGKQYRIEVDVAGGSTSKMQVGIYGEGLIFDNQPIVLGKLSAIFTITSGSNGSRYLDISNRNDDGLNDTLIINSVSVKEYLGQEVVPDSGRGSWLFEPQSTNIITYSDDFSQSTWTKQNNATVASNSTTSPNGEIDADLLNCPTTSRLLSSISVTNGVKYTFSIFIKKGTSSLFSIDLYDGGSNSLIYNFDTNVVSGGVTDNNIEDYGNGWHKLSGTITTASTTLFCFIYGNGGYSENEANTYIWGAQLEQQSFATSYIPTNGSTVTRLQDAAFGAGSSDLINSTEGVLYFEGERLSLLGSKRTICISDGSLNNYLYIQLQGVSNTVRIFYKTIETGQALLLNHNLSNELEFRKYAFRWSNNNFSLWINGIKEIEQLNGNTATSSILNQINFSLGNGADKFFGKTKCLAVFKEALTDEELECLTTI